MIFSPDTRVIVTSTSVFGFPLEGSIPIFSLLVVACILFIEPLINPNEFRIV